MLSAGPQLEVLTRARIDREGVSTQRSMDYQSPAGRQQNMKHSSCHFATQSPQISPSQDLLWTSMLFLILTLRKAREIKDRGTLPRTKGEASPQTVHRSHFLSSFHELFSDANTHSPSGALHPRRKSRSSSARIASNKFFELKDSSPAHSQGRAMSCQPHSPLSNKYNRGFPGHRPRNPRSLLSGKGTGSKIIKAQPRIRHDNCSRLSEHTYSAAAIPRSPASLLLARARESVELKTDWLGRRPAIMDVILDSKVSPAVEFTEDVLIEAVERCQSWLPGLRREAYNFTDEQSLDTYWADQSAIWRGMCSSEGPATRFPDSGERSTATWTAALNGGEHYNNSDGASAVVYRS